MERFEDRIARLLEPGGGGGPLTDAMVAEAEAHLGARLPADLVALLRIQNGGSVRRDLRACPAPHPTRWARDGSVSCEHLMGIGATGSSALSLVDSNEEWGQPRDLVLLAGDGHAWIAWTTARAVA